MDTTKASSRPTYRYHELRRDGWQIVKQSMDRRDFASGQDDWAISFIEQTGSEFVKMGESMWDILY